MKRTAFILLIALSSAWAWSGSAVRADDNRSSLTIMVLPFQWRTEITTDEIYYREGWPAQKEKYEKAVRRATARLIHELTGAGYRQAIEGNAPVINDRQHGTAAGGVPWPYIHPALSAGADELLQCDITRMEYSQRTSHYLFEMYSVTTYRLSATLEAKRVDVRAERTVKSAIITDSATHRVHRLFWDTIWIHHYTTGPDLAEKLMGTMAAKIVRAIR